MICIAFCPLLDYSLSLWLFFLILCLYLSLSHSLTLIPSNLVINELVYLFPHIPALRGLILIRINPEIEKGKAYLEILKVDYVVACVIVIVFTS